MSQLPLPLQPFRSGDFAKLMATKLPPPVIPNVETIPAPFDTGGSENSNTIMYVAIGVLAVGSAIVIIHLITENSALKYKLQETTGEVQKLSAQLTQQQSINNLLIEPKSKKHEQTT